MLRCRKSIHAENYAGFAWDDAGVGQERPGAVITNYSLT